MANRRMINSSVWADEKFILFDDLTRLVWFGLITSCDDQGRLLDNSILIKAQLFPADRKSKTAIEKSVEKLADAGMIKRYTKNGKAIIQIVNWWDHQTPSWAAPSSLEPPDNWVDRVKTMGLGRRVQMTNWEHSGGYVDDKVDDYVVTTYPPPDELPIATDSLQNKIKIKNKNLEEEEDARARAKVFQAYQSEIGVITPMTADDIRVTLEVDHIPADWIVAAIGEASRNNKRNWKYVSAIVQRWKVDGFQSRNKNKKQAQLDGYQVDRSSEVVVRDDGEEVDGEVQF